MYHSDHRTSETHVFACGVAAAGTGATWPLGQIEMTDDGVRIRPRWRWLGLLFPPDYEFRWADVRQVDVLTSFGSQRGLRFSLERPANVRRPLGAVFAFWPGQVRHVRVGLHAADLETAMTLVPSGVRLTPRAWMGP